MKTSTKIIITTVTLLYLIIFVTAIGTAAYGDYYIVNATTGKFHLPTCSYLPHSGNRYTIPREDIYKAKYAHLSPCGHCDPLNNFVYTPESPYQQGGYTGDGSGEPSGDYDHLEYQGEEHVEYHKFKKSYLDFVETYGILIPSAIIFVFSIYEGLARFFDWEGTKRLIGKVMLYGGILILFLNIVAFILGHVVFFIIEIFI